MTQDQANPTSGDSTIESLFEVTMRGYNKRQVEDYVAWLQNEVRTAQDEAKAATAQATEHGQALSRAREDLTAARTETPAPRPAHEEVSERLGQILRLADEEADQKRARAGEEAEATLEAAREQSNKVLEAARSAAEGIISAARDRTEKEGAAARTEAQRLLADATASSQATLHDAEQRAAQVLADADRRTASITSLQDERLAGLRDVHTDTLRRLESVRGVLEKVLTAEADAGPPDNGIAPAPLPLAGTALRPGDVVLPAAVAAPVAEADPGFGTAADYAHDATAGDHAEAGADASVGDPLLSKDYVEEVLGDDPLNAAQTVTSHDVTAHEVTETAGDAAGSISLGRN